MSVDVGPSLADLGQRQKLNNFGQVCPTLANIGQNVAKVGQSWPRLVDVCRNWGQLGQANFGQHFGNYAAIAELAGIAKGKFSDMCRATFG